MIFLLAAAVLAAHIKFHSVYISQQLKRVHNSYIHNLHMEGYVKQYKKK